MKKRAETDFMKLVASNYKVVPIKESLSEFIVVLDGPVGSLFESGRWEVRVELPCEYPYKSPSIGFINKIFHPNIDEISGSVCLDVINQTWSPMFDLLNIFEVFLPQLLLYPNPIDPLNQEAAVLLLKDPKGYEKRVMEYILKHSQKPEVCVSVCVSSETDTIEEDYSYEEFTESGLGL